MASSTSLSICRSCLSRRPSTALIRPSHARLLLPSTTSIKSRPPSSSSSPFSTTPSPSAAAKQPTSKPKPGGAGKPAAKKKKPKTHFKIWSQAATEKFALMDAVRYIRAFEVGRDQRQMKYELAVKLYTMKNGPTVKNRIRLPKAVKTDLRICVFAEGKAAAAATEAGASVVGVEELWDEGKIKAGKINFDRVICHKDVLPRLQKANLGRVLGPKGLMPSPKTGTVVANVTEAIQAMVGASEYRERAGVVRIAIGQLGFSAQELANNVKAFISALKSDLGRIEDFDKRINEIVLSSTNGPGFSLSGLFRSSVVEGQEEIEVEQDEVLEAVEEGEEAAEETVSVEDRLAAA